MNRFWYSLEVRYNVIFWFLLCMWMQWSSVVITVNTIRERFDPVAFVERRSYMAISIIISYTMRDTAVDMPSDRGRVQIFDWCYSYCLIAGTDKIRSIQSQFLGPDQPWRDWVDWTSKLLFICHQTASLTLRLHFLHFVYNFYLILFSDAEYLEQEYTMAPDCI